MSDADEPYFEYGHQYSVCTYPSRTAPSDLTQDQARYEYTRIVPWDGWPDTTDPGDAGAVLIPGKQRFGMEYEVRTVRQGAPLSDPDDEPAEDAR